MLAAVASSTAGVRRRQHLEAWSQAVSHPQLLALAHEDATVRLLTPEGLLATALDAVCADISGAAPACLRWHPTLMLLAIGWDNDTVTVWSLSAGHQRALKVSINPQSGITCLAWSSCTTAAGSISVAASHLVVLAAGSADGLLQPWSVMEATVEVQLRARHSMALQLDAPVTHITFGCDHQSLFSCTAPSATSTTIHGITASGAAEELIQLDGPAVAGFCWCEAAEKLVAASQCGTAWVLGRLGRRQRWAVELHLDCCHDDELKLRKAAQAVEAPEVWQSLAAAAFAAGSLPAFERCLANTRNPKALRALQQAAAEGVHEEVRLGLAAAHLGMLHEAELLLRGAGRLDLLAKVYLAMGAYERVPCTWPPQPALQKRWRRVMQHGRARALEEAGDIDAAIAAYEAADAHRVEVPRMLWEAERTEQLEQYIRTSGDAQLLRWWARHCEAEQRFEDALRCYEEAGDSVSQVRLHCHSGDLAAAEKLARSTGKSAVAFHLARHLEATQQAAKAMHWFQAAGKPRHALRVAASCRMDAAVLSLASKAGLLEEGADYFRETGDAATAAQLYQKAGLPEQAAAAALEAESPSAALLLAAAEALPQGATPQLLHCCGDALLRAGYTAEAVALLVGHQQHDAALQLCLEQDVRITEELAESLTPEKGAVAANEHDAVLVRLAAALQQQGSHLLACKKYSQVPGSKLEALRCLTAAGDVARVVFFAGVARQQGVYLEAALWLRATQGWRSDPQLQQQILTLLGKAHAEEEVAAFRAAIAAASNVGHVTAEAVPSGL